MKELVKDGGVVGSIEENVTPIVNTLPIKAQGRPLLIGAELDTTVQEYINAGGGGGVNTGIVQVCSCPRSVQVCARVIRSCYIHVTYVRT